jgi:hypothetical protein
MSEMLNCDTKNQLFKKKTTVLRIKMAIVSIEKYYILLKLYRFMNKRTT